MYKYEFTNKIINDINEWVEIPMKLPTRQTVQIVNQGLNNDLTSEIIIDVILHDRSHGYVPDNSQGGAGIAVKDFFVDDVASNVGVWVKSSVAGASVTVIEKSKG